jgi:predicted DsbA family dithiol-disulfide isomerase
MKMKDKMASKMKVEIWSDVMCPFCYIGKRKFESALNSFPQKDFIQVIWHSFQLNPNLQYEEGKDAYTYLAEIKGQTREWSVKVHNSLAQSAKSIGLDYNFEKAKIANSFDAHRIIQLAKKYNLTDEVEERFFRAYFTEGELISDHATLIRLATEAGLPKDEVSNVLQTKQYAEEVRKDVAEARQLGANGVPFFVMDMKYAVSGAQDTSIFAETLQKAFHEWEKLNTSVAPEAVNGQICTPEGVYE